MIGKDADFLKNMVFLKIKRYLITFNTQCPKCHSISANSLRGMAKSHIDWVTDGSKKFGVLWKCRVCNRVEISKVTNVMSSECTDHF